MYFSPASRGQHRAAASVSRCVCLADVGSCGQNAPGKLLHHGSSGLTDKMNTIHLTSIFFTLLTPIFGRHGADSDPCTEETCELKYNSFLRKHVLQENFDRNSETAWESYLDKKQLLNRPGAKVQSFLEPSQNVEDICTNGWRVLNGRSKNLCISRSDMTVYDVTTRDNNGQLIPPIPKPRKGPVIVACDKVGNRCLPVHYEKYTNQQATKIPC